MNNIQLSTISIETLCNQKKLNEFLLDDSNFQIFWSQTFDKKVKIFSFDLNTKKVSTHPKIKKVGGTIGYGGGGWSEHLGSIFYGDAARLYRYEPTNHKLVKLLFKTGDVASPIISPCGSWVVFVHRNEDDQDTLGVIDSYGKLWPQKLSDGFDFYAQPRWSPDGRQFCFIAWNHPHMPWVDSQLYVADVLMEGNFPKLTNIKKISSELQQACFQPEFSRDGKTIYYISDQSGWGQLYAYSLETKQTQKISNILGECGQPNWVQDMRTWCLSYDEKYAFLTISHQSQMKLVKIDLMNQQSEIVESISAMTDFQKIVSSKSQPFLVFIASAPTSAPKLMYYNYETDELNCIADCIEPCAVDHLTSPEVIHWPTLDGTRISGIYWKSKLPHQRITIIKAHSGPTSQSRMAWDLECQFFNSVGIDILCVNFRGSYGFGRDFMSLLKGMYGKFDVEDCISAANYLIQQFNIDLSRIYIMGSSSGGYTALQALSEENQEVFAGCISAYGITDLLALGEETHKFEKFYNDWLLGPVESDKMLLQLRSPINKIQNIRKPCLIFQGSADMVVPRRQADLFVEKLQEAGKQVKYVLYEGEGHGFAKLENRINYYQTIIEFLMGR